MSERMDGWVNARSNLWLQKSFDHWKLWIFFWIRDSLVSTKREGLELTQGRDDSGKAERGTTENYFGTQLECLFEGKGSK